MQYAKSQNLTFLFRKYLTINLWRSKPRIIRDYVTPDGHEPFEEWLDSLRDKKTQAIVLERLNRVRLGNLGDCRHLGDGVYELRIHLWSRLSCILW